MSGAKVIGAARFKEQCLALLESLDEEGLIVTKHGKPVARVLPASRGSADLLGCLKGKIEIHGDVYSTGLEWDAES